MKKEKIITALSENELDSISGGETSGSQVFKQGFFSTLGENLAWFCLAVATIAVSTTGIILINKI